MKAGDVRPVRFDQPESIEPLLLKRALAASRDGITIGDATDAELPLVFVNPAFVAMTGYDTYEVLGRNCRFLQGERADVSVLQMVRRAIRTGSPCLVTLKNYRKDGSMFWNELSLAPVRDAAAAITHFIGVQKDVTARVEATRRLSSERARLEADNLELESLAARDGLTGLFNRRHFHNALETEWRRAQREQKRLACFLLDVDHFKAFNDQYGHPAGDECLRAVAKTLRQTFQRAGDVVTRYGGEEFVVLGGDLDANRALKLGERLRGAIEALGIAHTRSATSNVVTVSVGVASMTPSDVASSATLVAAADAALYEAKSLGRNRVSQGLVTTESGV